ncbi:MAG: tRNA (guanosine(46)-N7)-methyltransferase TrmB [Lachnospiraceae bacterium]|nr:tRNA (guanosine(46)-N7)-methyltransferase TrmB [Lachnospiraceae bacterium]
MRLRNIPGSREAIGNSEYVIPEENECAGKWKEIFGNEQPVHIEIGTGKGRFLMELAEKHPEINYVGIEKYSSVLLRAIQKMEENPLPNVRFIRMEAEHILRYFEKGEVGRVYLNFSDPWPKERHAKRRLVSREFLDRYRVLLKPDGHLEFKTDNKDLFDFGVEQTEPAHWEIIEITYDLHHDEKMNAGNIMTEYEERFSSKGNPIYKYIIKPYKI